MKRKVTHIKLAIVKRGLIQADVARDTGISESRLSRIASGRIRPHEVEIKHLSRILGVRKEELI